MKKKNAWLRLGGRVGSRTIVELRDARRLFTVECDAGHRAKHGMRSKALGECRRCIQPSYAGLKYNVGDTLALGITVSGRDHAGRAKASCERGHTWVLTHRASTSSCGRCERELARPKLGEVICGRTVTKVDENTFDVVCGRGHAHTFRVRSDVTSSRCVACRRFYVVGMRDESGRELVRLHGKVPVWRCSEGHEAQGWKLDTVCQACNPRGKFSSDPNSPRFAALKGAK
jgi:hypothetical protein